MIIHCQCWVVNRYKSDQTASYNHFEPDLNGSVLVTNSIDSGGILEFSCCIGLVLASSVYPKNIKPFRHTTKYLLFYHYSNSEYLLLIDLNMTHKMTSNIIHTKNTHPKLFIFLKTSKIY